MSEGPLKLERKLAAILYGDVADYSRLTGEDEEGTHRTLSTYLDLFTALVARHGGKVDHFAGDAVLAEFASVLNALNCAVALQRDFSHRNADLPDERKVQFRIGLNLCDVIADRSEVYGDGVNVAARLETLAEAGGICISGPVFDAVGNKLPLTYEFIGEQRVKNITAPVRSYRVRWDPPGYRVLPALGQTFLPATAKLAKRGFIWPLLLSAAVLSLTGLVAVLAWRAGQQTSVPQDVQTAKAQPDSAPAAAPWARPDTDNPPLPAKPSIAVLPFSNLSGDPKEDYFSDGITDDLITALSRFRGLLVIASNTVFTFKGQPLNVRKVGQTLGVRYVVEGSVQRTPTRVRVNAQLIDTTSGHHLWAERYDRELKDIFSLQDQIVEMIASTMALEVDLAERKRAMQKTTEDLKAYDYLLQGREYLAQSTRSANGQAREMFEKAIQLDPQYAAAYAELGQAYWQASAWGWTEFLGQTLDQMELLSGQALRLDPSNAHAFRLLGQVARRQGKFGIAVNHLERALELNPNDADSRASLGTTLVYAGRTDEGLASLEKALRLNPNLLTQQVHSLAEAYYLKERYRDAIQVLERARVRTPNIAFVYVMLAATYAQAGRDEEAKQAAASVRRLHPFFEVDSYGSLFRDPAHRAAFQEGLRKAGLK
jgi:adenylate cyclase